ncbi:Phospholipase_D-nuclease N-terminal [Rhodococcus triatomae]|uniref:Phospholipase_D-nuclease N-terminal n=1 Tax=Rhodococcus triatomae TaxID=300028 RepID=A0A1G8L2X8_9NOCA|nr:Phospholipase_D-nuclease N-terminal [Rhodococcus triatomae]
MLGAIVVVGLLILALFVGAIVDIARSDTYQTGGKAVWILLVFAFPVLGPVVWFVWGRKSSFT